MEIIFLEIAWVAMILHTLVSPFGGILTPILGYIMIIGMVMYSVIGINYKKANKRIMLILILFIYCFFRALTGNVANRFDYVKNLVLFSCFLLCFIKRPQNYSSSVKQVFFLLNFCQAMIFCIFTYLPFKYKYTTANMYGHQIFTMGLGNPNSTSLMLLITMMILIIEICFSERRNIQIRNIVVCLLLCRTMFLLSSRAVIICFATYIVLIYFIRKGKKFGIQFFWSAVAISVLGILIQFALAKMDTIILLGKPLASGRDIMFDNILANIKARPFDYILGRPDIYGFGNYHNGPLSILCAIGIIGATWYYRMWNFQVRSILNNNETISQYIYAAILMVIVSTSTEAALLLGAIPFSIQLIALFSLGIDGFALPYNDNNPE